MRTRTGKPDTYVFTFSPMALEDDFVLRGFRRGVAAMNRRARQAGTAEFRVMVSPRLGRRNPTNWKRKNRFKPRLRLEDAKYADVYLVMK